MKTTDKKVLQTKTAKELAKMVEVSYKTLNEFRLDHVQGKLKNTRSIFNTRKDISIIQSVLHEVMKKEKEEQKQG